MHDQVSPCLTRPICDSSWTTRAVPVALPTRVVLLHSTPSGFGVDLMLKDPGLAAEASMQARATTPLGELARNLYALHSAQGHGTLDFSSILKLYRR